MNIVIDLTGNYICIAKANTLYSIEKTFKGKELFTAPSVDGHVVLAPLAEFEAPLELRDVSFSVFLLRVTHFSEYFINIWVVYPVSY